MYVVAIFIVVSIILGVSYSNFIVTSNNHKAAEMYIGALKYSIEIDGNSTNTLTIPTGETIIDVKVNNLNPVDTYYKLLYLKNSNLTVKYYETTKDTDDVVTTYSKPKDSITNSNSNTIKLKITNSSTSSQNIGLSVKGGYITNTVNDITTPSTYSEITLADTSTNTYFCKTNDTLTQGLQYVNKQYTYAYKQQGDYSSSGLAWNNMTNNGWGVQLTDKTSTDAVTSKLCTYINNKPITSMSNMFESSQSRTLDLSNFDTSKVTNMSSMFSVSQAITLNVSNFDTSNVTNMYAMFYDSQATALDLSNFDTSNVTNMRNMFMGSKATTIDVSNFNTSKVTDMTQMFSNSQATALDVSNFNTSKVRDMSYMFRGSKVTTLDLSNFDTSNVTDMNYMFNSSKNLKTIYVSNKFKIDSVTSSNYMFTGATKLVGGSGTKYNSSYVDKTYARIDGGTSSPGYFTERAADPSSFGTDSWGTIIFAVKNNNTSKYNVGDTKTIDLGTYGTHTIRIANKSTPTECSNTGFSQSACGFVLEFADIITRHNMNDGYATNLGGWPASSMYAFVNNDIYNAIPDEIKNAIIDTTVVSGHGSRNDDNFTSTDKLYLLSTAEIWTQGSSDTIDYDSARDNTRQLDYYSSLGTSTSNYSGAIKKDESGDSWWWLRTAYSNNYLYFYDVNTSGVQSGHKSSNATIGVSPAFRIG